MFRTAEFHAYQMNGSVSALVFLRVLHFFDLV
jgi:hypothetical protein